MINDCLVSWSINPEKQSSAHWVKDNGLVACGFRHPKGAEFRLEQPDEQTICKSCLILMREDHRLRAQALKDGKDLRR